MISNPSTAQATKQYFVPVNPTAAQRTIGSQKVVANIAAPGQFCNMVGFIAPWDFSSLTEAVLIIDQFGLGAPAHTIDWTVDTNFNAVGEMSNIHADQVTENGRAVPSAVTMELDILAAFTGMLAGDYVGARFELDAWANVTAVYVSGIRFRYN